MGWHVARQGARADESYMDGPCMADLTCVDTCAARGHGGLHVAKARLQFCRKKKRCRNRKTLAVKRPPQDHKRATVCGTGRNCILPFAARSTGCKTPDRRTKTEFVSRTCLPDNSAFALSALSNHSPPQNPHRGFSFCPLEKGRPSVRHKLRGQDAGPTPGARVVGGLSARPQQAPVLRRGYDHQGFWVQGSGL